MFEGREIGTAFYKGTQGPGGDRYNPDFAMWAKACGADGYTVTRSEDFKGYTAGEATGYSRGHEAGFAKGAMLGALATIGTLTAAGLAVLFSKK